MAYRIRKTPVSSGTLSGSRLAAMLCAASAALKRQEENINRLNVFPVPDGDTGTNMSLTLSAAAAALSRTGNAGGVGEVAKTAADAMLRGARGNSGVILSLLFRGFAKTLKDKDECTGALLAKALNEGVEAAYKAVMKPAEGTILTVARVAAEEAARAGSHAGVEQVLTAAAAGARRALEKTLEMNPVLKKAGVVDAGGTGWTVILETMLAALQGEELPTEEEPPAAISEDSQSADFAALQDEDIRFTYCTEFIAGRHPGTDPEPLRSFLLSVGDSMVFIPDEDIIKVHIHTDDPGRVLSEALRYGFLQTVKVENMRLQHTRLAAGAAPAPAQPAPEPVDEPAALAGKKPCGVVAVCTGRGFKDLFLSLGADATVTGGQTMNPSTEDILRAVETVNADTVFVLPNNKNIVMAARQCVGLTDKTITVIPTATFPQGVAALAGCDLSSGDASSIESDMLSSLKGVRTAQVTFAARDSEFNGHPIRAGEHLALLDGELLGSYTAMPELLGALCDALEPSEPDCLTVYRGCDAPAGEQDGVAEALSARFPEAELSVMDGGQPVYSYIISAE